MIQDDVQSAWINMVMDRLQEVETRNDRLAADCLVLRAENEQLKAQVDAMKIGKAEQQVHLLLGPTFRIATEDSRLHFQKLINGEWLSRIVLS